MLISLNMYISPNTMRGKTALQIDYMSLGEMQMKEKGAKITVTRVFADKRIKLFDLFSNFVAKRIMAESGMIPQNEESSNERISDKLDIADLKW